MLVLIGLFTAAVVAATLLPAQSEAVLVTLVLGGAYPVWLLLLVATVGNVLGSVINWALGRFLLRFKDRRWFPASPRHIERATHWYRRWGYWSLLASWLPIIGDPLTLVAGVLRVSLWRFILIVTLAKSGRYLALTSGTLWLTTGFE